MAVRCNVRPICSAILMKRCENTESRTGSGEVNSFRSKDCAFLLSAMSILMSPLPTTVASLPGSTTVVIPPRTSIRIAGPFTVIPGLRSLSKKTLVSNQPWPAKYVLWFTADFGNLRETFAFFVLTASSIFCCTAASETPNARTRTSSTITSLPGMVNPCSLKYSSANALTVSSPFFLLIMMPKSVPSYLIFRYHSDAMLSF
mmetsp:Transcript_24757/g.65099  ORF Transcript_24757/g.65099 Transcript_24757/m.65099 type:complete len:202 (-) Transcript_24757:1282-1887(-)